MLKNVQAMEIQKGLSALTTGTITGVKLISCMADGDISVAFPGGAETVSMTAGMDRAVGGHNITITSGTFDINK